MRSYHRWTAEERALLGHLWPTHSVGYICRRLGMNLSQVCNQAARMGLQRRQRAWTAPEERLLLRSVEVRTIREAGLALGRSRSSVKQHLMKIRRRLLVLHRASA